MNGWSGQLPERIAAPVLERLIEGSWFRFSASSPEPSGGPAIGKIKSIRSPQGERVAVLWLDADCPERISIQVYAAEEVTGQQAYFLRWVDGYAIGHPVDDEDDIYSDDGTVDEAALISVIYESLENMEYSLVGRRELMNQWAAYRNGGHLTWPNEPWMEGGENR